MPYDKVEFNVGDIVTVIDYDENYASNTAWILEFAPEYLRRWEERKEPVATSKLNGDIGEIVATSKSPRCSASLIDFGDTIRLIHNNGLKKVEHIIEIS